MAELTTQKILAHQESASDEGELLLRVALGDESALRLLMDRHDTLVRYTIFRTSREQASKDPQWLDSVATQTWEGLIHAVRRKATIGSVAAYMVGIARQQTLSALRRLRSFARVEQANLGVDQPKDRQVDADPATLLGEFESLSSLRDCIARLAVEDRQVLTQLEAITARHWVEAGRTLGLSESTLRSRWTKILERLRRCMERTGM